MSSCVVAGGSTEIVSRVAGPMLTKANPFRFKFRDAYGRGFIERRCPHCDRVRHIRPVCEGHSADAGHASRVGEENVNIHYRL